MAYEKNTWVARIGDGLNRFLKENETTTHVELTTDPTAVTQEGTAFSADWMNNIEDGIENNDIAIENKYLDVTLHGVDNTGTSQIQPKLQPLLDLANTNGSVSLYFPPGDYLVDDYLYMYSNTKWIASSAATFKRSPTSSRSTFINIGSFPDSGGYGSGGVNIYMQGGRYEGYAPTQYGLYIGMHHVKGFVAKDMHFYLSCFYAHSFDLIGSEEILIDNCIFEGYEVYSSSPSREFTEAIQLDCSCEGAGDDFGTYWDGLATRNVIIQNCTTKAIYDTSGNVSYYGQSLVGNHTYTQNYYENIKIINNTWIDCFPRENTGHSGTWLRLYATKNCLIDGNSFINTKGIYNNAISLQCKAEAQDVTGGTTSPVVMPNENIIITNNVFEGFNADIDNRFNSLIYIYGYNYSSVDYYNKNIVIDSNVSIDCRGATNGIGCYFVKPALTEGLIISNNSVWGIKALIACFSGDNCIDVAINGNLIKDTTYNPIYFTECQKVNVIGNTIESANGNIWVGNSSTVNVNGNIIDNIYQTLGTNDHNAIWIYGSNNVNCNNNAINNIGSGIVYGIHVSTSSNGINVIGNNIQSSLGSNAIYDSGSNTNLIIANNNTYS